MVKLCRFWKIFVKISIINGNGSPHQPNQHQLRNTRKFLNYSLHLQNSTPLGDILVLDTVTFFHNTQPVNVSSKTVLNALKWIKNYKSAQRKMCQNTSFLSPIFSRTMPKYTIISSYGKIWVKENSYFDTFYAVVAADKSDTE